LALDEPNDSDSVFDNGGVQYIVDNNLLQMTGDITIDFVTEGWRSGFSISTENPVAGSCSMGGTCSAQGSCP
jgi:iron-sulfur cluster assembly protein